MSLLRSSLKFASGTFLSRLTGVLRESVLAGVFGVSHLLDAFIIANRIPNLLRELLAEGALGASFTKVYANLREVDKTGHRSALFLIQSLQFFSLIIGLLCLLGIIFAPELVQVMTLLAPQSVTQEVFLHNTIGLTRVLFPFIALMTVGSIASGVLHQKGMFFTSAISSVALNVGYIVGALVFANAFSTYAPEWVEVHVAERSITGLAFGVLLGGFLQTMIQFRGIKKSDLETASRSFRLPWSSDVKHVCLLMGPMILAGSAGQINVLVNTNFASSLQEGAVTWLNFSFRILQLPIGIFAVGIGLISLPTLSKAMARKASNLEVTRHLQEALLLISWLVAPCFCFLLLNSEDVTRLLYQHGKFTDFDTMATAEALYAYSFALFAYGFLKVLTSYYYARERTRYAMYVSLFSMSVNLLANMLFVRELGHKGLAFATSITLSMNALLLFLGLNKDPLEWEWKKVGKSSALMLLAFILAYGAQAFLQSFSGSWSLLAHMPLKLSAFAKLSANGIMVLLIFGIFYGLDGRRLSRR